MNTDSQTYALLYCQYDSENSCRRYDRISYDTIVQLDIQVAQAAVAHEALSEITKIIYFGSPNAQQLTDHQERSQYARTIITSLPRSFNS